jgi:transposase
MARAYSLDLRERVVEAVTAGQTCRVVAKRFEVSVSSVVKWNQLFRSTGTAAAKPMGGNALMRWPENGTGCWLGWPRRRT